MRLLSYTQDGQWRAAINAGGTVVDASKLLENAPDLRDGRPTACTMTELLTHYTPVLDRLGEHAARCAAAGGPGCVGSEAELCLGAPVPDARKVICVGLNYRKHVEETGRTSSAFPDLFAKFSSSLVGPFDDLHVSSVSQQIDYEGELAVVIGRPCTRVTPERALDHLAGVTIFNDITARDLQHHGSQWLAGKALDGSTPCGPALVTLDELGDVQNLTLATRVNGAEVQRADSSLMIFPIAEIVAYISRFLTLMPGDVVATGTPDGVGSRREPPVWMQPGDVIEVEVPGIGALRNVVR